MADYSISTVITADSTDFEKNIKKAEKSVKGFSAELQTVTKALGALFVGRQIIDFGKKSVKLLEQERKETALLNKTLQITGASAWETQDALVSMAQELERNSNYSQEQIMRAQTVMLGFKSVTGEVFDSAIQNVIDMSEVMGIDLVNSVQTIGKALDDPIKGLGSLSRQGFVFSEQQKAMLANMVEVGDKAGAQKIILDELTSTYGGAGRAGQNAFQKLNVAIGNFQKTLASNLVPTITSLSESVTGLLEDFNSLDKGTQAFILTAGGLVTALPLIVKGIKGLKIALVSLQASVPVLLGISAGIVAISAVVGTVVKKKNEFAELTKEIKLIGETTDSYLDTYAQGNEAKVLDEEATKRLIELYPELTGKINAYSDSVADARNKVQELVNKKLLDAESTGIEDYIQQLNKIQKLREKATKYESTRNEMDRARAVEILTKEIPAVVKLAETQRQAINERLKGIGKMIAYDGKVVDIPVEVKPQITPADTDTKRRWQEVLAEALQIDESSFSTSKQAVGVYLSSVAQTVRQDKSISNALGEAFNIKDVLTAQQENIKQSINDILASVNVDAPFSVGDFERQNSALAQLAERYRAISAELKGIKINDEIADLEKQVANLGKSELELYASELKANGATEEQIKHATKLKKQLMQAGKETSNFADSWDKLVENLKADAEDWSDVANSITEGIKSVAMDAMESIGASLVEGEDAWDDYGTTALKAIAEILKALAMQLTALAAVNLVTFNFGKAATAAAAAAAALVGAGALKAIAKSSEKTAESSEKTADRTEAIDYNLKNSVETLDEFRARWFELLNGQKSVGDVFLNIPKLQKESSDFLAIMNANRKAYDEYRKALAINDFSGSRGLLSLREGLLAINQAGYQAYVNALFKYNDAQEKLLSIKNNYINELKAESQEIQYLINAYKDLYDSQIDYAYFFTKNDVSKQMILNTQLKTLKEDMLKTIEGLMDTGKNIGETLMNSISEGASKSDFLSDMKNIIKKNMLKIAIFTEDFTSSLASVGTNLATAIVRHDKSGALTIKNELSYLWTIAENRAKNVNDILDSVFGTVEEKVDDFVQTVKELGTDIANGLIEGLSNGLSQSDFLQNMYDWIRKLIVQTVVYTESMKSEIEAIGKAISDGLSKGFTTDSLHEIRRDLSYIFFSANKQMEGIDSVLDSVFKGYATGTDNATRGLHLVGEAGPELVAFHGGEKVYNAEETSRMLNGGNNFNVTFNNTQDTTAFAMIQQLRQYNREMAINGIF